MNLDGILLFNKRTGITSFAALDELRQSLKLRKIGHCGTLDNFASGLLLVCMGQALKIVQLLENLDKEYLAKIRLGVSTDTYDIQGTTLSSLTNLNLDEKKVTKVIESFRGQLWQAPPPYSALKYKGRRLSDYAREGTPIVKESRKVRINSLEILKLFLPFVDLRISCSKGTYIRSLAHDIGNRLNCGAHLTSLTRIRIGPFKLQKALDIEKIRRCSSFSKIQSQLISVETALSFLPSIKVTDSFAAKIKNGPDLKIKDLSTVEKEFSEGESICVKNESNQVIALAKALRSSADLSGADRKEKIIEYMRVFVR
ncbi:MAG: tRNA pseudouridine(55) synthase TruB [candidate division Zixibacteria bacterium]|nr:tRNA pseudouridine(55) synthase TruB [candidate division Zixibacteria bacterium]